MSSGLGLGRRGERPYRKHRPLPALIVIAIFGVGAIGVWLNVMLSGGDIDAAVRCEPPASPPPGTSYTALPHEALDNVAPIPPDKIAITVLNAGSMRGQAGMTTSSLRELGFTQASEPANDPAYQGREAQCRGQLRFGDNGATAARTLSLMAPCVELVKDNRRDASVDLSVGSSFGDLRPPSEALDILRQLRTWSAQHAGSGGEQAAQAAPPVDPEQLDAARETTC